jgi:hypothetical protein
LDEDEGQLIELALAIAKKRSVLRARQGSKDGLHDRALKRRLPTSKHKLHGYRWQSDQRLAPDDNWDTVKLIFDWLLQGKSYDWIILELKKRGVMSPAGQPEWNKSTLSSLAHNPAYAGRYYALKKVAVEPTKRKGNTYGNSSQQKLPLEQAVYLPEIEIINPPITWEQRSQILDQLARHQKLAQRNAKRDYLLRGFIFCGTHRGKEGEPRRYHGQPKRDTFYYCCPVGGCPHPYIPGPELDDWVQEVVLDLLVDSEDQIAKVLEDKANQERTRDKLYQELAGVQAEYDRRITALADLEMRNAMLKAEEKPYRREACNRAREHIEARCEWLRNREAAIVDELAQLGQIKSAWATLKNLWGRFGKRLDTMSNQDWQELFSILNLEIHVSPEEFEEFDPYKPEFHWLEFRFGIPLSSGEAKMDAGGTTSSIVEVVLASPERG